MTTHTLISGLYFLKQISHEKELIVLVKLQIIVVLTTAIVAVRFLAYNLQSIHSMRYDKLLQSLLQYGGLWLCFRALWRP